MAPLVLTGMQCGLLSSHALIVTMLLSACSEGADPICPWAVDSTCSEGQVSGQEGRGGWSQFVGHLQRKGGCTFSAYVVRGFP